MAGPTVDMETPMSVIVFGATGDLARKKLYPALYQLMFGCPDAPLIPPTANVVGYGRSEVDLGQHLAKQCVNVNGEHKERYLGQCKFFAGAYDKEESFTRLHAFLSELEGGGKANRLYFFSVPPTVFGAVVRCIKASAQAPAGGWTRLILEKPFGRDSQTFADLDSLTSSLFTEDELFRIDHYLGKEIVLNLVALRFGNQMFEAIWNREQIASVEIVFKEDLGTGGRGGYFDGFGIIRDIMQNHLLQVLMWFAIEPPKDLSRASIQEAKVRLLQSIKTLTMDDVFLGQFGRNSWTVGGQLHEEPGYLDDKTVPEGSKCPTYAAVAMQIDNDRWRGVPFIMRAGKGLDERMSEVRVTFKKQAFNALVPGDANELVMRIQPDESIFLKYQNKVPGWDQSKAMPVVLDMSLSKSFPGAYVADAYERMFLNAAKGDGSLFVGAGELTEAWRIFTPLLHEIDERKPEPVVYPFGVRVPDGMDAWSARYGITMAHNWQEHLAMFAGHFAELRTVFDRLAKTQAGVLYPQEVKELCKHFFDEREPTDKQVAMIMSRLDKDGDGHITYEELEQSVSSLASYCQPGYHDDPHIR